MKKIEVKPMKKAVLLMGVAALAWGQTNQPRPTAPPSAQYLRAAKVYTAEEDSQILKLYDGLRVSDVIDGGYLARGARAKLRVLLSSHWTSAT